MGAWGLWGGGGSSAEVANAPLLCVCVCVCARVRVSACVCVCVRACVRALVQQACQSAKCAHLADAPMRACVQVTEGIIQAKWNAFGYRFMLLLLLEHCVYLGLFIVYMFLLRAYNLTYDLSDPLASSSASAVTVTDVTQQV